MRLIDADAFKEYIRGACKEMSHVYKDGGKWAKQITEDFCMDIDEQPTIEERKTGKWLPDNTHPYAIMFTCSECKESVCSPVTSSFKPIWKYCPNCGADMRGEEHE